MSEASTQRPSEAQENGTDRSPAQAAAEPETSGAGTRPGEEPVIDATDRFGQPHDGENRAAPGDGEPPPSRNATTQPEHNGYVTRECVEEAMTLLKFLCDQGKAVEQADVTTLVAASRCFGTQDWNKELEARYWASRTKVSNLALPDTVTSIRRAYTASDGGSWVMRVLALLILFCALAGHVYAFKLESSLQSIAGIEAKMEPHATKLIELDANINRISRQASSPAEEPLSAELDQLNQSREVALYSLFSLVNEAQSHFASLAHLAFFLPPVEEQEGPADPYVIDGYKFTVGNHVLKSHSAAMLELIKSYVLPGLYGVLGALAYVLRTHQASRRRSSLLDTTGDYFARVVLGLVAGVAIGLFLKPDAVNGSPEATSIATLTPVALAFLAGYAVELLFNVMDRIVTAFSGNAPARTGQ